MNIGEMNGDLLHTTGEITMEENIFLTLGFP